MCTFNTLLSFLTDSTNAMTRGLLFAVFLLTCSISQGQLLNWSPSFIREDANPVEITVDALKGNKGLKDFSGDVYVHIGVITTSSASSTDWKYSKFTWGTADAQAKATSLGNNKWKYTINGGLRNFFAIANTAEKILRIAILFRSSNGNTVQRNADGSDMYVPVYEAGLQVRLDQPLRQPTYNPVPEPLTLLVGDNLGINAIASESASLTLLFNGMIVSTQSSASAIAENVVISSEGSQEIVVRAESGATLKTDTIRFFVAGSTPVLPLPAGVRDGINYEAGDTSVILVLFAPGKTRVSVLAEFNNWTETLSGQMNKTPDGNRFWVRITGLTPGTEYAYQFLVDGQLKIADYYAEKVLDPDNDRFIPSETYPGLKAYPAGKTTGIVSVLQTGKPAYNWKTTTFTRPDKRNLIVYELLVRDFVAKQNYQTLIDTLSYLKRLGINVIELMPVNEFEGNNSWGYNPSFYFAPDKAYGTENKLREFIDSCHQNGIAVVLDIALNHSFGQSPMVQLYFDAAAGKPAVNNPWFNTDARHPFNVGYDINHESQATKDFVDRVVEHWLANYRIDGFRWDLSKGFTQVNNPNDVTAWSRYDASRIAIWKRIYNTMQVYSAGSYCILEHFADNNEETELSDYGMLLWGNLNFNFNEATMGFIPSSNFENGIHTKRNWRKPHLVTYQESHDEERLMFKNNSFGNSSNTGHNVRDPLIGLKRNEMAAAFWSMIPGPKMLWQFGEVGYDYSITWCPATNTIPLPYPNQACRTDPKPPRWDYVTQPNRLSLYNTYARLLELRRNPDYLLTFTTDTVAWDLSGSIKWMSTSGGALKVMVVGNFDVTTKTGSVTFPDAGTWYSYLGSGNRVATGSAENITLQPGEFYVYTSKDLNNPVTSVSDLRPDYSDNSLIVYPNPLAVNSKITYEIPETGRVNILLRNMQGQVVAHIFSGVKPKGRHSLPLQSGTLMVSDLPSGTYLLVVEANGRRMKNQVLVQH
jgi:glycosidase